MILVELFITFFLIGALNFGGGGAMLPLIQTQVVNVHAWISESEFTDIIAISQMTPGPMGINCATYVGFEVGGVAGSLVATFALVLPSFLLFFALVKIIDRFGTHPVYLGIMKGLKPCVAGMIAAAALMFIFHIDLTPQSLDISVIGENFPNWKAWALGATSLILSLATKISPLYLIIASGVIGLIIF